MLSFPVTARRTGFLAELINFPERARNAAAIARSARVDAAPCVDTSVVVVLVGVRPRDGVRDGERRRGMARQPMWSLLMPTREDDDGVLIDRAERRRRRNCVTAQACVLTVVFAFALYVASAMIVAVYAN